MKNRYFRIPALLLAMGLLTFPALMLNAQDVPAAYHPDTLKKAALEIIKASPFCALVTVDATGQPQVRTMNPFPLQDDMVIWFATARKSRKVNEIRDNPAVSVYFADHNQANGYASISGRAEILDDKALLVKMKRDYWENIPGWQDNFVLIRITPVTLDVVNYLRGVTGDRENSRAPRLIF